MTKFGPLGMVEQNESPENRGNQIYVLPPFNIIFDDPGGNRSVTGVRDTIFPMQRTDEANHHIAVNQQLSRSREILTP